MLTKGVKRKEISNEEIGNQPNAENQDHAKRQKTNNPSSETKATNDTTSSIHQEQKTTSKKKNVTKKTNVTFSAEKKPIPSKEEFIEHIKACLFANRDITKSCKIFSSRFSQRPRDNKEIFPCTNLRSDREKIQIFFDNLRISQYFSIVPTAGTNRTGTIKFESYPSETVAKTNILDYFWMAVDTVQDFDRKQHARSSSTIFYNKIITSTTPSLASSSANSSLSTNATEEEEVDVVTVGDSKDIQTISFDNLKSFIDKQEPKDVSLLITAFSLASVSCAGNGYEIKSTSESYTTLLTKFLKKLNLHNFFHFTIEDVKNNGRSIVRIDKFDEFQKVLNVVMEQNINTGFYPDIKVIDSNTQDKIKRTIESGQYDLNALKKKARDIFVYARANKYYNSHPSVIKNTIDEFLRKFDIKFEIACKTEKKDGKSLHYLHINSRSSLLGILLHIINYDRSHAAIPLVYREITQDDEATENIFSSNLSKGVSPSDSVVSAEKSNQRKKMSLEDLKTLVHGMEEEKLDLLQRKAIDLASMTCMGNKYLLRGKGIVRAREEKENIEKFLRDVGLENSCSVIITRDPKICGRHIIEITHFEKFQKILNIVRKLDPSAGFFPEIKPIDSAIKTKIKAVLKEEKSLGKVQDNARRMFAYARIKKKNYMSTKKGSTVKDSIRSFLQKFNLLDEFKVTLEKDKDSGPLKCLSIEPHDVFLGILNYIINYDQPHAEIPFAKCVTSQAANTTSSTAALTSTPSSSVSKLTSISQLQKYHVREKKEIIHTAVQPISSEKEFVKQITDVLLHMEKQVLKSYKLSAANFKNKLPMLSGNEEKEFVTGSSAAKDIKKTVPDFLKRLGIFDYFTIYVLSYGKKVPGTMHFCSHSSTTANETSIFKFWRIALNTVLDFNPELHATAASASAKSMDLESKETEEAKEAVSNAASAEEASDMSDADDSTSKAVLHKDALSITTEATVADMKNTNEAMDASSFDDSTILNSSLEEGVNKTTEDDELLNSLGDKDIREILNTDVDLDIELDILSTTSTTTSSTAASTTAKPSSSSYGELQKTHGLFKTRRSPSCENPSIEQEQKRGLNSSRVLP